MTPQGSLVASLRVDPTLELRSMWQPSSLNPRSLISMMVEVGLEPGYNSEVSFLVGSDEELIGLFSRNNKHGNNGRRPFFNSRYSFKWLGFPLSC